MKRGKRVIRKRRRDGVVQRYHVGRKPRKRLSRRNYGFSPSDDDASDRHKHSRRSKDWQDKISGDFSKYYAGAHHYEDDADKETKDLLDEYEESKRMHNISKLETEADKKAFERSKSRSDELVDKVVKQMEDFQKDLNQGKFSEELEKIRNPLWRITGDKGTPLSPADIDARFATVEESLGKKQNTSATEELKDLLKKREELMKSRQEALNQIKEKEASRDKSIEGLEKLSDNSDNMSKLQEKSLKELTKAQKKAMEQMVEKEKANMEVMMQQISSKSYRDYLTALDTKSMLENEEKKMEKELRKRANQIMQELNKAKKQRKRDSGIIIIEPKKKQEGGGI